MPLRSARRRLYVRPQWQRFAGVLSLHVAWVQALPPDAVEAGQAWLQAVADAVVPPA